MMDLQERLRAHMDSELAVTRQSDLGEVMQRGETMRKRRRVVSATLPAAAVLVVVLGVVVFDGRGDTPPPVDVVAAQETRLSIEPGTLDWEGQPAALGTRQQAAQAEDLVYVLSTAPGARFQDFPDGNLPRAIYSSNDGTEWASHPVDGFSSIAANGGLLYAVGTAPGANAGSMIVNVGRSSDGGASFATSEVPVEVPPGAMVNTDVAATGGGILAVVSSRVSNDLWSVLPPDVLEGAVEPLAVESPEPGVAVFPVEVAEMAWEACQRDSAECADLVEAEATHFATLDELGIDGEVGPHGDQVTYSAYWSEGGQDFEEIEYPLPEGVVQSIHNVGDRALVEISGGGGSSLFLSGDARSWQPVDMPPISWVRSAGQVGDRVVIVADSMNGASSTVFHAPGLDGPWEQVDLAELVDMPADEEAFMWTTAATVGDSGVAVNVTLEQQQRGGGLRSLMDRLVGGGSDPAATVPLREEAVERGEEVQRQSTSLLLHSADLTSWRAISTSDLGPHVDSLLTMPDGRLIAHSSARNENGQPVRLQYTAQP